MADVKISGLPASTVPLAGTEVLPIVQGGVTKQVSVANLTDGRNVTVGAGTVSLPAITTTGDTNTGIYFPAADTIAFTEGGAESVRINASGQVGIGVTNPTRKLHVVQNATISTSSFDTSTFSQFLGTSGVSASTSLGFQATTSNGSQGYAAITCAPTSDYRSALIATYTGDAFGTGYFAINRYAATGSTSEVLRADSTGQVGIGTSSPVGNLHVSSTGTPTLYVKTSIDTGADGTIFVGGARGSNSTSDIAGLQFWNYANQSTSGQYAMGIISGRDPSANSALKNGALIFQTNNAGTLGERMRIHNSGGVSIGNTTDPGATNLSVTGNVVMATSGKGIDFSATAGTGTSELLADYEEGTWTATASGETTPPTTPVTATCTYTKIGRLVTVIGQFDGANMTGGSGTLQVTGLPYAPTATSIGSAFTNMSGVADISYIPSGQSRIIFIIATSGAVENVNATTNRNIWFTATYQA